jgi:hypothetical protein
MLRNNYKHSEETKRKIGLANAISLKGKHCSPKTEFKKGSSGFNRDHTKESKI